MYYLGKSIINDNIRIDTPTLSAALVPVRAWLAQQDLAQAEGMGAGRHGGGVSEPVYSLARGEKGTEVEEEWEGGSRSGGGGGGGGELVAKAVVVYLIGRRAEHYLGISKKKKARVPGLLAFTRTKA
jgi:hypothetical protein